MAQRQNQYQSQQQIEAQRNYVMQQQQQINNLQQYHRRPVNYKPPLGQTAFIKFQKIRDTFKDNEYVRRDNQTDIFNFGSDDFQIHEIYHHYYTKQNRYPIQGFMDVYFHDALQELSQKESKDMENLRKKTIKFSQLAQKLYNLNIVEQRLIARKAYEQGLGQKLNLV